ncbi:MAG: hypothetical protein ACPGYV_03500 [Phycisphaeraceae bacterium]
MTSEDVQKIVERELAEYTYVPPPPGTTYGTPWSQDKVYRYRDELLTHLVEPVLKQVILRDTYAQVTASTLQFADVWVVAEFAGYLIFFDPAHAEFGLAQQSVVGSGYVTIGVRGDLVGVYCAA